MKFVALLSGGKDSCFNLLHCSQNGHELIAVASLGPGHGKEELDSYLYQTVGQGAIEFIARALKVPLYRRVISGDAVEQGSQYGSRNPQDDGVQGDETEDLHEILSTVKFYHPEVQGVSVGAILSNYQRVRIEHVCRRLSLTPLSYLWQRNQSQLLSEMIEAGVDAILIKVAGIGLTADHLGKTLVDMQPILLELHERYGSHVCGEGGEYETLTLDCSLFKHRITLTEVEPVILSDNDLGPVAFLRIKNAALAPKNESPYLYPSIPHLLDTNFAAVCDRIKESQKVLVKSTKSSVIPPVTLLGDHKSSKALGSWVAVTNVQRKVSEVIEQVSLEAEVHECFRELKEALAQYWLNLSHCSHINLFLSSIDLFDRVNAVYASYFGTSPPARACVAVDLPFPIRVKLDCVASAKDPVDRQALHVQSLSYWAPANIGPYSQAIMVDERVFLSGQIGLIPCNLSLPSPSSLAFEVALSFQHVKRVVDALRNNTGRGWVGHTQLALYWLIDGNDIPYLKKACEEYENPPVPTLFLGVKAIPKGALVEKQVFLHTGRRFIPDGDDDDDPSLQPRVPFFEQGELSENGLFVHWETSRFEDSGSPCAIACFRGKEARCDLPILTTIFGESWTGCLSIRLFYRPSPAFSSPSKFEALFGPGRCPPITYVPCRHISTLKHDDWDYAMCILGNT